MPDKLVKYSNELGLFLSLEREKYIQPEKSIEKNTVKSSEKKQSKPCPESYMGYYRGGKLGQEKKKSNKK